MTEKDFDKKFEKKHSRKLWNGTTITILLLALLLLCAVGYIGANEYAKAKSNRELGIYQQGVQVGTTQIITYLFQQGATCQPVPVFMNNHTLTMMPLECIHAQAKSCTPLPLTVTNHTLNMIAVECLGQR